MRNYTAWRATFQDAEQAARAAYQSTEEMGAAYNRLRSLIGAKDAPGAKTPQEVWQHAEQTAATLVEMLERQNKALQQARAVRAHLEAELGTARRNADGLETAGLRVAGCMIDAPDGDVGVGFNSGLSLARGIIAEEIERGGE